MKMKKSDYEILKKAILRNEISINDHREFLIKENKCKNLEKRLRWDIFYSAISSIYVCDNFYPYLDDTHIDTALKQIMREIKT